jgi:hypothetical protein
MEKAESLDIAIAIEIQTCQSERYPGLWKFRSGFDLLAFHRVGSRRSYSEVQFRLIKRDVEIFQGGTTLPSSRRLFVSGINTLCVTDGKREASRRT